MKRGFEWLGFDFLVDENHRVWLLEVNVSPDVSHSTAVTAGLAPQATADALNGTSGVC
jgi:D-alanine-D-alanine ligase-like ATP-grasp enzyme